MAKKKLTPRQKAQRNLQRRIKYYEKKGFYFDPATVAKMMKKQTKGLEELKLYKLQSLAEWFVTDEGEVISPQEKRRRDDENRKKGIPPWKIGIEKIRRTIEDYGAAGSSEVQKELERLLDEAINSVGEQAVGQAVFDKYSSNDIDATIRYAYEYHDSLGNWAFHRFEEMMSGVVSLSKQAIKLQEDGEYFPTTAQTYEDFTFNKI